MLLAHVTALLVIYIVAARKDNGRSTAICRATKSVCVRLCVWPAVQPLQIFAKKYKKKGNLGRSTFPNGTERLRETEREREMERERE